MHKFLARHCNLHLRRSTRHWLRGRARLLHLSLRIPTAWCERFGVLVSPADLTTVVAAK
jgi:hypothetical protein